MKYCKHCKVNVDTDRDYCPLCFREISGEDSTKTPMFAERKNNEHGNRRSDFILKLFIFITLCIVSVCLIINFLADPEVLWSLIVISGLTYVWVLVVHTVMSRRGAFEKALFQLLAIIFILVTSNSVSPKHFWLPEFVYQSISICAVSALALIVLIRKDKSWILAFLGITVMLTFASGVILLKKMDTFILLNLINVIYSSLVVLAYFIFGTEQIKQQFSKIFHL